MSNPNQLLHHHTNVQDNPFCGEPMHIEIPEGNLVACLQIEGTCIFLDTLTTSNCEMDTLPHVVLMSQYPWVPKNFKLPKFADSLKEEVDIRRVASVSSIQYNLTF